MMCKQAGGKNLAKHLGSSKEKPKSAYHRIKVNLGLQCLFRNSILKPGNAQGDAQQIKNFKEKSQILRN
jgi:hypothetical protein